MRIPIEAYVMSLNEDDHFVFTDKDNFSHIKDDEINNADLVLSSELVNKLYKKYNGVKIGKFIELNKLINLQSLDVINSNLTDKEKISIMNHIIKIRLKLQQLFERLV